MYSNILCSPSPSSSALDIFIFSKPNSLALLEKRLLILIPNCFIKSVPGVMAEVFHLLLLLLISLVFLISSLSSANCF